MRNKVDEFYNKDNEVGIVREYINKVNVRDLAKKYNTSTDTVCKITKKYGVNGMYKCGKRVKSEDTLTGKIIKMYQEDKMSIAAIEKSVGISRQRVKNALINANVKIRNTGPNKMNTEAVDRMYKAGIPKKKIAEIMEVTPPAIYNYIGSITTEKEKEEEKLKKKGEKKHIVISEGDVIVLKTKRDNNVFKKELLVESTNGKYIVCKHPEGYKETLTTVDLILGFTSKKMQLATC